MMKGFKNIFHSVSLFCTHTMYLFEFGNNSSFISPFSVGFRSTLCLQMCDLFIKQEHEPGSTVCELSVKCASFQRKMQITEGNMIHLAACAFFWIY